MKGKKTSRTAALAIAIVMMFSVLAQIYIVYADLEPVPPYRNPELSPEERAADLVSRMTLEEKQSQLIPNTTNASITRLGLNAYQYQNEALHGVAKDGSTSFSSPIGMASSWNLELMRGIGDIVGAEIRSYREQSNRRNEGISYWSPTMEVQRDPRWGRNEEVYSEDVYLATMMGSMFVDGMQIGSDPIPNPYREGENYLLSTPTLKHYVANNSENNRFDETANVDNKVLRDYYTRPFQRIVERTNVASLMTAYNAVNGVPASASVYLNEILLRKVFGFTGYTVGDCGAITRLHDDARFGGRNNQKYVHNYNEAAAIGLIGGTDQDCGGGITFTRGDNVYSNFTIDALNDPAVPFDEDDIDRALVRILTMRFKSGEFDPVNSEFYDKYKFTETSESDAHRDHALLAAQQAAILLKNDNALPINAYTAGNINVYGPMARRTDLGDYSGRPFHDMQNLKVGLREYLIKNKGYTDNDFNYRFSNYNVVPEADFINPNSKVTVTDALTPTIVGLTNAMVAVGWIGFGPNDIRQPAKQLSRSGANNTPVEGVDYSGVTFEGTSHRNLNNVNEGGWVKFTNVDIEVAELRVWSGTIQDYSTQAIFHVGSLDGPILGVVTMAPSWGINSDGSREWHRYPRDRAEGLNATPTDRPTGFGPINTNNWYEAGYTSTWGAQTPLGEVFRPLVNPETNQQPRSSIDYEEYTKGSFIDTGLKDAIGQYGLEGKIHDVYVRFQYLRQNEVQDEEIEKLEARSGSDSVSIVYVGTTSGFGRRDDSRGSANAALGEGRDLYYYNRIENASINWGGFRVCGEHSDRSDIKLPANQEELILKVAEEARKTPGKKVVVAMQAVGAIDVSAFVDKVDAIIWTPYNGQRQAEALSSLLMGDYNPGGKTTQTWYKDDGQLPDTEDGFHLNYDIYPSRVKSQNGVDAGRTYTYFTGTPRYTFGYGLSYTKFDVTNVSINRTSVTANGEVTVTATVKNTGGRRGAEVVQVYVVPPNSEKDEVPARELKGFARVELNPGEAKTVNIVLDVKDWSVIDGSGLEEFEIDREHINALDFETKLQMSTDSKEVTGGGHMKRHTVLGGYKIEVGTSMMEYDVNMYKGNVTGSGKVDVNDLLFIRNHILGTNRLDDDDELWAADANSDGVINIFDMLTVRNTILGSPRPLEKRTVTRGGLMTAGTVNVTEDLKEEIKVATLQYRQFVTASGVTFGDPMLSIVMADETFLPLDTPGLTVVYKNISKNQTNGGSVVVDPATGEIEAIRGGTALIAAEITYKGQTVTSIAHPVAVAHYPYISNLAIDGKPIEGFSINRTVYEYQLPIDQDAFPEVTFDYPGGANVVISEPETITSFSGTYTITVSVPGELSVTYRIEFRYPSDATNPLVGTVRKNTGMNAVTQGEGNIRIDWATVDQNQDGVSAINLRAAGTNADNMWLTFNIHINAPEEMKVKYGNWMTNSTYLNRGYINIRSTDLASGTRGGTEARFGWIITPAWGLQYGINHIRIPLKYLLGYSPEYFVPSTGDLSNQADGYHEWTLAPQATSGTKAIAGEAYSINVNGVDVPVTEERSRGAVALGLSAINRILFNFDLREGALRADRDFFDVQLHDFRFVDETFLKTIEERREVLQGMLVTKLQPGTYDPVLYAAYVEAYDAASRVVEFAGSLNPINHFIEELQTATAALG
ncbi:MAG: glycoside hydrolase family 3 C-terminal domain-containing protein [Oscillospiraceae bacterium]|nr:glycoside hydrolase family 3 C-terminal domain-containing protein [Oscillospiraceae bacterium]